MNKTVKYLILFSGSIILLWMLGRATNMLQWYSSPTSANYPTITSGEKFFATNLMTPKRFQFICYYATTPDYGKEIWVHRLCGLAGDTIEIKDGDLYINNQNADGKLSLAHNYILPATDLEHLKGIMKTDASFVQKVAEDSFSIDLPDKTVAAYAIRARRLVLTRGYQDEFIGDQFGKPWNQDQFGPVVVPAGKYFVLGDNRWSSRDSRYIGFVDQSDYVATVIGQ